MREKYDLLIDENIMPDFTKKEFLLFRDFISKKSGIYFDEEMADVLRMGLNSCLSQKNMKDYYQYYNLLNSPQGQEEFKELLKYITIGETKFFRNPNQFKVLKEKILPELICKKRDKDKRIRIWSAGCSTGEEPYSIAMSVRDVFPSTEGWSIDIFATDVNKQVLQAAKEAVYNERSMALVDKEHIDKYFELYGENKYHLKDSIRNMVRFDYFNLIEESYPGAIAREWDIIFCRNVTIYFNVELTKRVIENFYNSLTDGGYFFVGSAEILASTNNKFSLVQGEKVFYYQRNPEHEAGEDKVKERIFKSLKDKKNDEAKDEKFDLEECYGKALVFYERKLLDNSLKLLDKAKKHNPENIYLYLTAANILFDQQKYDEAIQECAAGLKCDPLSYHIYFLLGSIYQKNNMIEDAITEFRKSIYAEKKFMLAYLAMAEIYIESDQTEAALREIDNAVWAAEQGLKDNYLNINKNIIEDLMAKICKFLVVKKT